MYQQIQIVGNVGRDPEMRYTSQGVAVCSFSVAVSVGYGENKKTEWFKVSAWRNQAEICSQYVTKGMQIMVTGEVKASAYTGQDGQPRASLEINAKDVVFLSRRGDTPAGDYQGNHDNYQGQEQEDLDDIPF